MRFSTAIIQFGCIVLLAGCGETRVRQSDGSSVPQAGIFGTVSDKERIVSLPTEQRRRAVAIALHGRYELSQLKIIKRADATQLKPNAIGGGESMCIKVEYSDAIGGREATDQLLVSIGAMGAQPITMTDVTRALMNQACMADPHAEFVEFRQIKDALAQKRNPLTLAAAP
jgi:hypothetical protein